MKQIPLRTFQLKATEYLDSLPIELTRYGKVIARVFPPNKIPHYAGITPGVPELSTDESKKIIQKKEKEVAPILEEISAARGFWVCEHGNRGRLCKHEKCRQMAVKKGDA